MKTLSKLIVVAFATAALFFTINVKAQTTPADSLRFNIGLEAADPTGTARIGAGSKRNGKIITDTILQTHRTA